MILKEKDVLVNEGRSYQIQGKIGSESTFGAVFKALNGDGEPVVVKQLLGPGRIEHDAGLDYQYVRLTFEREAKILVDHAHPQIVKGLDFFQQEDDLFLVMEFINGEDLDQILIKRTDHDNGLPFSEEEAVPMGISICRVLHAIHQFPGQILFRDLKPRNIMWDAANRTIKLIDFGTARFMDQGCHATQALGTPGYAPPEFYSTSSPVSFASDVYTIGATLFELVTGEVPEPLHTPRTFHGQDTRLSSDFREIIRKAMSQDPKKRYRTAEEMAVALESLPSAGAPVLVPGSIRNPYPYLSCLCIGCGARPQNAQSVFCTQCGEKIHVVMLRILPKTSTTPAMDLFLEKEENLVGRMDMESGVYPDVDLSRYDPECYVSRKHCRLRRDKTRFFIEPLPSTNPTLINGYPGSPNRPVEISPKTEITLADLKILFTVKPCLNET